MQSHKLKIKRCLIIRLNHYCSLSTIDTPSFQKRACDFFSILQKEFSCVLQHVSHAEDVVSDDCNIMSL